MHHTIHEVVIPASLDPVWYVAVKDCPTKSIFPKSADMEISSDVDLCFATCEHPQFMTVH